MKSIVIVTDNPDSGDKPFPKLMICIHTGLIVLMTDECSGTFVGNQSKIYPFGHYSDTWNINHFTDFTGSVTLSND